MDGANSDADHEGAGGEQSDMTGMVMASHGEFATGLLDALRLIAGPEVEERVRAIGLAAQESPGAFAGRLAAAANQVDDGSGVLFLVDMRGGTPFNQAALLAAAHPGWAVVHGVNLPMATELVLGAQGLGVSELIELAVARGQEGVGALAPTAADDASPTATSSIQLVPIPTSPAALPTTPSGGPPLQRRVQATLTYQEIMAQEATLPQTADLLARLYHQQRGEWWRPTDRPGTHASAWPLFVGCGSSFYLAGYAASLHQTWAHRPALAMPAGSFWLGEASWRAYQPWLGSPVVVGITRSGTTTEVLRALQEARALHLPTAVLTCAERSPVLDLADRSLVLPHVHEESVVMTQSFANMMLALEWTAAAAAGDDSAAILRALAAVVTEPGSWLAAAEHFAQTHLNPTDQKFVYLGSGANQFLAHEAALKLKEMSGLACDAFVPLEFRHGPQAIVDATTLLALLPSSRPFPREEELRLLREQRDHGATTVVLGEFGAEPTPGLEPGSAPARPDELLLARHRALAEAQLFALYTTVQRGGRPDRPRHLTRSVLL